MPANEDWNRFGPRVAALIQIGEQRIAAARERKPDPFMLSGAGVFQWDLMRADVMMAALKALLLGRDFVPWVPQLLQFGINPLDIIDVVKAGLAHELANRPKKAR